MSKLTPHKAKSTPPIPVPTNGKTGVFAVSCATEISAPAKLCLAKTLDLQNYPAWNTFVPNASVTKPGSPESLPAELQALAGSVAPGAKLRFTAVMVPGEAARTVELEVTRLEVFEEDGRRGYRVAWKSVGFLDFLLRAERVQEFVESADDGVVVTRYSCWETFGGLLAYLIPQAPLLDAFDRWTDGLKTVAERAG